MSIFKRLSFKMAVIFISVTVLVVAITGTVFVFLFNDHSYKDKKQVLMDTAEAYADLLTSEATIYSNVHPATTP